MIKYIVMDTEVDSPIAMDGPSGGYPYIPRNISNIKMFDTIDEASKYCNVMDWKQTGKYEVRELSLKIGTLNLRKYQT